MATNKKTPNTGVNGSSKSGSSNVSGNMSSPNTGSGNISSNMSSGIGSGISSGSGIGSGLSSGSSNPGGSAFGSMASSGNSSSSNPDIVSTLNSLIETCKDGQLGFKDAADGVENSQLKSLFSQFSSQRAQFVNELQNCVKSLGATPETSGHISGTVHRGWLNIKSAITGHDEHAIIAECERGEDFAVKKYEEACQLNLPSQLKSVVERQYREVKAAHDKIHQLDETDGNVSGNLGNVSSPGVSGNSSVNPGSSSMSSGNSWSSGSKPGSTNTGSSSMSNKPNSNPSGTTGNMSSNSQVGGGNISGNMSSNSGQSGKSGNKPDSRSQF